jgi:uncharacterized RDD family membrane protein YckC
MSTIRIATNFNIDIEFTAAPFHKRLIAWALDLILQVVYLIIASRFLKVLIQRMDPSKDNDYNLWAIVLVLLLPFLLYHVVCEITMNGQSIGKKIMNIKVVNENGGKPSISQYIIRWLIRTSDYMLLMIILYTPYAMMFGGKFFSAIAASVVLLVVDVIMVNTSKKGQRLGDLLAHTILISTKQHGDIEDTVFLQVAETYQPVYAQVMQLSDRDINSLKSLLDNAKRRHDYELAERTAERLKTHLKIETSQSPFDFLETLLKDYNSLSVKI